MNYLLVGIVVSFVLTGITFVATQNIFLAAPIFLVSIAFFVLVVNRKMKKNQLKVHRYHQCFHFINSFIISLNVKGSMSAAIQSGYETTDEDTKTIIDSIKELNEEEKITYLCKYFKFDLYRLFVDTINLWNEEGGDILKMSQYLINQVRLKEQYLLTCETIHRQKTIEFVVLWSMAVHRPAFDHDASCTGLPDSELHHLHQARLVRDIPAADCCSIFRSQPVERLPHEAVLHGSSP